MDIRTFFIRSRRYTELVIKNGAAAIPAKLSNTLTKQESVIQQADVPKQTDDSLHGGEVAIQLRPKLDEALLRLAGLASDAQHRQPTDLEI